MVADVVSSFQCMKLAGPDMLVDNYDQYTNHENEVVNISPDDASEGPSENLPRADDCMSSSSSTHHRHAH